MLMRFDTIQPKLRRPGCHHQPAHQHAPTWHNGQCPKPLEALILRLLAKDPSQRPSSAADVLTALEAIETTAVVGEAEEAHVLDSLAGGVFVGRQREMRKLKATLEEALSGKGRLVTLVGEPGIGKARTAQELATYVGLRQAQVLWGRCYEGLGVPPYWPWIQAVRSYVSEHDPDQLRSEMGAGLHRPSTHLPVSTLLRR